MPRLPLVALIVAGANVVTATTFNIISYYLIDGCSGYPNRVDVELKSSCNAECKDVPEGDWISHNFDCSADYENAIWESFDSAAYIIQEALDSGCETLIEASASLAYGTCEQVITTVPDWGFATYSIAQLEVDGSASIRYFNDSECNMSLLDNVRLTENINTQDVNIDAAILGTTSCDTNGFRWKYYDSSRPYLPGSSGGSSKTGSSGSTTTSSSSSGMSPIKKDEADANVLPETTATSPSGTSLGTICGIVAGTFAALLVVLGFIYCRRRSNEKCTTTSEPRRGSRSRSWYLDHESPAECLATTTPMTVNSSSKEGSSLGQCGLWNDDVITAKRISRRKVLTKHLLSRGAFGEVYAGMYNDKRVAVKMLAPELRGVIQQVNNFLAEAKMTATMDHPRIVHFVGVAWDSLSDLCVVMEYMEGGDLRVLLSGYENANHPVGIDREKATIALHVCHALTYMHSLSPPVIHRDLKSRNILLNHAMEAKLTDFGISRERLDSTMTAGVGTSLWMAPEVMLGEKYDDKADMFSFGVVLSELDTHTLPYARSKERNLDSNGRRLPDAIILQQVTMGRLCVDFSEAAPASIKELGFACVSVDPSLRPTAAEALYKIQVALTQELA